MKVLHLIPSYLPGHLASGPIMPTHFLNRELVKKGVKVVVYTTNRDGCKKLNVPINKEVDIDGVKIFYFKSFGPSFWFFSFGFWKAVARTIGEFDIVHITSVFLAASTMGAYYARKFKKPYIISPHGSLMKEPLTMKSGFKKKVYIDLFEKRNLAYAAAIHFTAEVEKKEYLEMALPLKKSFVIPNGFDGGEFQKRPPLGLFRNKFNISPEKDVVLFLSRINWKKGLDTLIPAFKGVLEKNNSAVLVIVGGDAEGYKKNVQELISHFQINDKVIFAGELFEDMRSAAYYESDVFVLPSYSENFGMAVIEAMYCELPAIVTEGVGISKNIANARAGVVIKKDEKELTDAIIGLLSNKEGAKEIGKRGRAFIQDEFATTGVAQKMYDEYNKLIREYGATVNT